MPINPRTQTRINETLSELRDANPQYLERIAKVQELMHFGDTFWEEDERTGATLKDDGKWYAVTAWRADHIGSGVFYTIANENGHDRLIEALIHAGCIVDEEEEK